jgi:hypothetical protein
MHRIKNFLVFKHQLITASKRAIPYVRQFAFYEEALPVLGQGPGKIPRKSSFSQSSPQAFLSDRSELVHNIREVEASFLFLNDRFPVPIPFFY